MPKDHLSACLLWLAQESGISTSRDALVGGLPLVNGSLTPSVFVRAAKRAHLHASLTKQRLLELNELLFPSVLILNNNRACVLLSIDTTNKTACVLLPELDMQPQQLTLEELHQAYTGYAIYCRPEFRLEKNKAGESTKSELHDHWFWDVIKRNRSVYRDVLIAALVINVFALTMPLFVMNVYDRVVPNHATDTLWVLAIGVFVVICADLLLRLLRAWFIELAANRADITLSARIMERVLGARLEYAPVSVGSFASNVQSFESVRAFIGSMTVAALIDLPFFLLFVLIIALISWVMVIPVLIGAAVVVLYALAVQSNMHRLTDAMNQASAQRNSDLIESLVAAPTLKSFNATSAVQNNWEKATQFLSATASKQRLLGTSLGASAAWVQQVVAVSMIIIGVYLVVDGKMSQGGLIAAYMLSSRAMAPVSQTASLLTQYYQAMIGYQSVEQIMANEQERAPDKAFVSRGQIRGDIEFRNVSLRYPDAEKDALSNISLTIKAGEKIAILGRVGSGKSSLEKLIVGLYRPTSGAVLIDGVNIGQIDPAELRRSIGYIPQEVQLLNGTVLQNITLGIAHPEEKRIWQAIELSGLKTLVGENADGLAMPVGEGGKRLSGGQRQTIAVARAMMPQSSILLLDEPTSAMDSTLENHVANSLKTFARNKTLLLVTHRTSLLHLVDRLIVMDGGRIVADGPKEEVLQALQTGSIQRVAP